MQAADAPASAPAPSRGPRAHGQLLVGQDGAARRGRSRSARPTTLVGLEGRDAGARALVAEVVGLDRQRRRPRRARARSSGARSRGPAPRRHARRSRPSPRSTARRGRRRATISRQLVRVDAHRVVGDVGQAACRSCSASRCRRRRGRRHPRAGDAEGVVGHADQVGRELARGTSSRRAKFASCVRRRIGERAGQQHELVGAEAHPLDRLPDLLERRRARRQQHRLARRRDRLEQRLVGDVGRWRSCRSGTRIDSSASTAGRSNGVAKKTMPSSRQASAISAYSRVVELVRELERLVLRCWSRTGPSSTSATPAR